MALRAGDDAVQEEQIVNDGCTEARCENLSPSPCVSLILPLDYYDACRYSALAAPPPPERNNTSYDEKKSMVVAARGRVHSEFPQVTYVLMLTMEDAHTTDVSIDVSECTSAFFSTHQAQGRSNRTTTATGWRPHNN